MSSDFHQSAFDDSTLLKLEIYRRYLGAWLPVFIQRKVTDEWDGRINVFDFFCGPGKDKDGKDGSPVIALRECMKYTDQLQSKERKIGLYFSDSRVRKIGALRSLLDEFAVPESIEIETDRCNFNESFQKNIQWMKGAANLLFIDQCGIKQVNREVFERLVRIKRSDFLFFIASSFFRRFHKSSEFREYLDTRGFLDEDTPWKETHRAIASMYRSMIPPDVEFHLSPFSLKKGANIYGLIFGSGNLVGVNKFLDICWKLDPDRGEANFDIDKDLLPRSGENLDLFRDNDRSKKVAHFQAGLRRKILAGQLCTDSEVTAHALECGFLPVKHAKTVVSSMIKNGEITCDGAPRLALDFKKVPREIKPCST